MLIYGWVYFVMMLLSDSLNINGFFLGNYCIRFCDTARNLDFTLHSHLTTLEKQVKECVSSVFASIKSSARIKHLLTRKEVIILVSSLNLSKLYCNSLYYDISCSRYKTIAICLKLRSKTDLQLEKIWPCHWVTAWTTLVFDEV